ncbi:hemagglutinin repeat-containing protein [Pseudomonas sp. S2_F03]
MKGAVASGETVKVKVGGDLNIESLQDTSTYKSQQSSANIGGESVRSTVLCWHQQRQRRHRPATHAKRLRQCQ